MKRKTRLFSLILICSIIFCSLPINAHADDSFEVPAPIIEITTNKTNYRTFDVAQIKVKVYASEEVPVENVNIETTLDKQLSCTSAASLSKETALLTDEAIEYTFGIVVAKNATGLNFFQKIIAFFKSLFIRTFSAKGKTYSDGRTKTSESLKATFGSVSGTITVDVWYQGTIQNTDTDGDGLIDYIERVSGMNPNLADTDGDGLNDFDEFVTIRTDPTKKDTDGNGINDFDDDNDADGLTNGFEISIGTNANSSDTDCDGLDDKIERETYHTDPLKEDTDDDGATDGWEVDNGFNPTKKDSSFRVTVEAKSDDLTASVTVNTNGKTAESISVVPVENNPLIDETIPGNLGSAFEFNSDGDLGTVSISFTFDEGLQNNPGFEPTIYCLNEETQCLDEYNTTVSGNTATTQSTHFSTYILLDKNIYEAYYVKAYQVNYSLDTGDDSNHDGISDFMTKLMCDGIIRTSTGKKVFESYTYEQIQSNDDFDGDGIINGNEISFSTESDPSVETETLYFSGDGHYYQIIDDSMTWAQASSACRNMGGHLATITTPEENQFLCNCISLYGNKTTYWIGLSDRANEGVFQWITGEPYSFSSWDVHQPDNNMDSCHLYNNNDGEDYGEVLIKNGSLVWNDNVNQGVHTEPGYRLGDHGFICEWNRPVTQLPYALLKSSPVHSDTDNDGIYDCKDTAPFTFGLKDGIIGTAKLFADTRGGGHAFIVFDSYVNMSVTVTDYAYNYYNDNSSVMTLYTNNYITLGLMSLSDEKDGFCINAEENKGGESYYHDRISTKSEITKEQFDTILTCFQNNNSYRLFHHNCATIATLAWNQAFGTEYQCRNGVDLPDQLASSIKESGQYDVNDTFTSFFNNKCEKCDPTRIAQFH